MENDISLLINTIVFIGISYSCFKFFNFSDLNYDLSEKETNAKIKHQELIKLKNEIEYINNKFNINYTKAKRGELNKKDVPHNLPKKFRF